MTLKPGHGSQDLAAQHRISLPSDEASSFTKVVGNACRLYPSKRNGIPPSQMQMSNKMKKKTYFQMKKETYFQVPYRFRFCKTVRRRRGTNVYISLHVLNTWGSAQSSTPQKAMHVAVRAYRLTEFS
mmetsp:Transcript_6225/g.11445  ORF Transcript_6225/g.11445 Transcript_6225/m.11445 type:complete len:127 (-) Transcript_6225:29-409(-)